MLTADVRFEGWTTESWGRFLSLWKPRAAAHLEPTRARGAVVCVHQKGRLRKLLHTHTGRIDPTEVDWPAPLEELAIRYRASWVFSMEQGALDEVMERFAARLTRNDDLTAQTIHLVNVFREMTLSGHIERWPRRLQGLPAPTTPVIDRALDSVCPDHSAIALGLFSGGEVWTVFVARRNGAGFDVIAGPSELIPQMGLLSGDWRRDYRHLSRAIEERYSRVAFGLWADEQDFQRLIRDPTPGAWSRAYAVREILFSPTPTAVRLALGVDGARFAYEGMRVFTGRIEALQMFEPVFAEVRRKVGAAAGDLDVSRVLGFDPLAALRALLAR